MRSDRYIGDVRYVPLEEAERIADRAVALVKEAGRRRSPTPRDVVSALCALGYIHPHKKETRDGK